MVEVPGHREHPQPAGDAGPLTFAGSYAVLCAAQAATTLVPRRRAAARGRRILWTVAPAVALGLGVAVLRVAPDGAQTLAWLGAVATPLLATLRTPLALGVWLVAWLVHGLVAQAAAVVLVGLAAGAVAELAGRVAPARALAAAIVVLAAVDVVLVWGTPQVEPASSALHAVRLPHGLPRLQDATFGHATMGWLDFVAPALVGVVVRRRLRAAIATGAGAGLWGLLFFVTSTLPATVPAIAGLTCARARSRHLGRPRQPRRARGGARGDRQGRPGRALVPRGRRRLRGAAERVLRGSAPARKYLPGGES